MTGSSRYPLYNEPFRPQYHFTPPAGFMNDPAGLVYWNGWQLYYQYNPFNMKAGYPSWGHAFSRDLLHWQKSTDRDSERAGGTNFYRQRSC